MPFYTVIFSRYNDHTRGLDGLDGLDFLNRFLLPLFFVPACSRRAAGPSVAPRPSTPRRTCPRPACRKTHPTQQASKQAAARSTQHAESLGN